MLKLREHSCERIRSNYENMCAYSEGIIFKLIWEDFYMIWKFNFVIQYNRKNKDKLAPCEAKSAYWSKVTCMK